MPAIFSQAVFVSEAMLRAHFRKREASTKQEIASLLAQDFPDLAWRLPPPRKAWQHEHRNMPMFDAVALGTSYFASTQSSPKQFDVSSS